jgi:hypothetical protein
MAWSDYLVSSREYSDLVATTIEVDGGAAENVAAIAGGLYLVHPTDAISMLDQLAAAMTAGGATTPAAFLTEAGYVRLTAGATFTLDWGDTTFRNLLGFTGNLSGAAAYTASNRSQLLWRSGKRLTPERSPIGSHGQPVLDLSVAVGPGGEQTVREEGDPTYVQVWSGRYIPLSRYFAATPSLAAGDYGHFWLFELSTNQKWYVLSGAEEGSSTTAAADLSGATALGPYRADMTDRDMRRLQFNREQGFERVEAFYSIRIPCTVCDEFV